MFEVESGVAIPPKKAIANIQKANSAQYDHRRKYPWGAMGIGDSFMIPCEPEDVQRMSSRIGGQLTYRKKNTSTMFTLRAVEGGLRIWRIQ